MSKLRKKFITLLAVLLCAMLTFAVTLIYLPKDKAAEAATNVTINELYNSGEGRFDYGNLKELYNAVLDNAGGNDKTYTDVKNEATVDGIALADKEIQVTFGGKEWTVVYLSKASDSYAGNAAPTKGKAANEDVILTLWLSNPVSARWQITTNLPENNYSAKYPTNLYGTSYLRTFYLNNGGARWVDDGNLINQQQAQNSDFARFTMDDAEKSVTNYLVSPRYICWQYNQSLNTTSNYQYDLNNEAWGDTGDTKFYTRNGAPWYYANKYLSEPVDYYSVWKDDLLWCPSLTETGGYNNSSGLWQTTVGQRQCQTGDHTLLRSAYYEATRRVCGLDSDGTYRDNDVVYISSMYLVRPALHLNLTKADGNSRKVFYDGDKEVDEFYTGGKIGLTVTDYDKLVDSNISSNSYYTNTTGEFYAVLPNNGNEKYEITLTPTDDFYWADYTDENKKQEGRKYYIHIKPAQISSGLNNEYSVTYGQNLIQTPNITSLSATGYIDFEIKYHKEFNSQSPPSDSDKPSETDEQQWSSDNGTFTADTKGYYRIWYRITATNHTTLVSSYLVKVGADSVTANVTGVFGDGSAEYAKDDALLLTDADKLKSWFEELVDSGGITMTGKEGNYSAADMKGLLKTMTLILCTKNSSGNLVKAVLNSHDNYGVGEYYINFEGSGDINFTWTGSSVFEVTKRTVKVKIIAQGGGIPTHVYGESRASMDYEIVSGIAPNEGIADLKLGTTYKIVSSNNGYSGALNSSAPAGEYGIEVTASDSNYNVNFVDSKYTVTPRPIKLKVADETVKYGTDFSNYPFAALIDVDGSLVGSDTITATRYYISYDGGEMELSSTLSVGTHSLCAEATSSNYEILEIIAGTLTINKADYDMSGVKFDNVGYAYDGNPHPAQISGVPDGVTVSYRYVNVADGSESTDPPVEIGLYLVYASFTHNNENYNPINNRVAYIRIAATQEEADKPFPTPPTQEEIEAAAQLAKKKAEAKKSLEEVANAKKEEIAAMEISDEEKAKANAEIDKELAAGNAAIDAVDAAAGESGVEQAFNEGKKKIEDISVACKAAEELGKKKKAAKDELEQAAKDKNAEIDADEELTDEEKAEAKKKVEEELQKGNAAIDGATDTNGVQSAQSTSRTNIENIKGIHKEDSSFPWWILALVAGVLALAAVLIIVIIKRRQTADGDDDYYDDYYDDEYDFDEEDYDDTDFGDDEF